MLSYTALMASCRWSASNTWKHRQHIPSSSRICVGEWLPDVGFKEEGECSTWSSQVEACFTLALKINADEEQLRDLLHFTSSRISSQPRTCAGYLVKTPRWFLSSENILLILILALDQLRDEFLLRIQDHFILFFQYLILFPGSFGVLL